MRPSMVSLLALIRSKEAPKGYGQIYSGARGVSKDIDCTKYTIDGVLGLQARMIKAGSRSTACAGYQFIRRTLMAVKSGMGLTGREMMTPDMQDRMAIYLMQGRGLNRYMAGTMTVEDFCNNLAMEWASLPVVKRIFNPAKGYNR